MMGFFYLELRRHIVYLILLSKEGERGSDVDH